MQKPIFSRWQSGFTLMELMIVVLIIGIMVAIALPSYQNYIEKGEMAEAKQVALSLRQAVEKDRLANPNRYKNKADFLNRVKNIQATVIKNDHPVRKRYIISEPAMYPVNSNMPSTFTLTFQPIKSDKKYSLTLNASGDVLRCKKGTSTCEKF